MEPGPDELFGTRPPALYVRFAQWCYDRAVGNPGEAHSLYWQLLGLESDDVDSKGYSSPFELYSIGDYDGDQVGWVVLAPELTSEDYPWIWYQHDGDSISVLAKNTTEFFTRILSYALVNKPEVAAEAAEAAAHLGLAISRELGESVAIFGASNYYERNEPAPTLKVDVPEGWRYVPADPIEGGVGVLAPAATFATGAHVMDRRKDPLEAAVEHGNNSHAASALWHLLTPHSRHGTQMSEYGDWLRFVKEAYRLLGRPQLAERVQRFEAGY